MIRFTRSALSKLFIIKKSLHYTSKDMEPEKNIKNINWETDTFGDYPFIKSTFRSERVWTDVGKINADL